MRDVLFGDNGGWMAGVYKFLTMGTLVGVPTALGEIGGR